MSDPKHGRKKNFFKKSSETPSSIHKVVPCRKLRHFGLEWKSSSGGEGVNIFHVEKSFFYFLILSRLAPVAGRSEVCTLLWNTFVIFSQFCLLFAPFKSYFDKLPELLWRCHVDIRDQRLWLDNLCKFHDDWREKIFPCERRYDILEIFLSVRPKAWTKEKIFQKVIGDP